MLIRNTYPDHGHRSDFFSLDELLMSLRNGDHLMN